VSGLLAQIQQLLPAIVSQTLFSLVLKAAEKEGGQILLAHLRFHWGRNISNKPRTFVE
jgi:hypothetical protein